MATEEKEKTIGEAKHKEEIEPAFKPLVEDVISIDNKLTLMNIYLTEWCHRDELLWKQIYTYFYATLIVLFLPNLTAFIGLESLGLQPWVFSLAALLMSLVFLLSLWDTQSA